MAGGGGGRCGGAAALVFPVAAATRAFICSNLDMAGLADDGGAGLGLDAVGATVGDAPFAASSRARTASALAFASATIFAISTFPAPAPPCAGAGAGEPLLERDLLCALSLSSSSG